MARRSGLPRFRYYDLVMAAFVTILSFPRNRGGEVATVDLPGAGRGRSGGDIVSFPFYVMATC